MPDTAASPHRIAGAIPSPVCRLLTSPIVASPTRGTATGWISSLTWFTRRSTERWTIDMAQSRGPLDGVKVVACSTAQAGTVPYVLMADLGAEVIKIEVPGKGDNSRASSVFPGLPSTYFET